MSGSLANFVTFNPNEYMSQIVAAASKLKETLPADFTPKVAITLGSGGLGDLAKHVQLVCDPISYAQVPGFIPTTVEGHEGKILFGTIGEKDQKVSVVVFQGRKHYYELFSQRPYPMMDIVFPVHVAYELGARLYIGTNAAGGINTSYKPGDIMIIDAHNSYRLPNPLLGPLVPHGNPLRFVPQNTQYPMHLKAILHKAAQEEGIEEFVHEGVYAGLTGPTFETKAEIIELRTTGADAVGMSTIPEIIAATSLGVETLGVSLITNVTAPDGTNATTHEEVMQALNDPQVRHRVERFFLKSFTLLAQTGNYC